MEGGTAEHNFGAARLSVTCWSRGEHNRDRLPAARTSRKMIFSSPMIAPVRPGGDRSIDLSASRVQYDPEGCADASTVFTLVAKRTSKPASRAARAMGK